ncbi:sporulation protein, YlmC/YmxH family [Proteiniborus ethanoligenes]|uniref:Sporulation protein, YlmC/YmxH family n=1 Tax=Proteiniborus ethanoligenes TaxID=415015 RepID=A0A1H3N839_9FIRM|nr:YlmC/YmxH family sporulation protein [Proteiniborus ethanoligenes]TAH61034.1 MAG: YlmC/YmxH family sporulation protein [Gottschalkiaceae bacterium]SDY84830.1 sporulation protein, YlmC/YmxH family [Proteiniborus ethanoligenes]
MRLSELGGKEIVNLNDGGRLGIVADSDLIIDDKSGKILALLVPDRRSQFRIFSLNDKGGIEIPWSSIRKIGNDMIIIELDEEARSKRIFTV